MSNITEIEFDLNEIARDIGLPQINVKITQLENALSELLGHIVTLENQIKKLNGEPSITQTLIPQRNQVGLDIHYPPVPTGISFDSEQDGFVLKFENGSTNGVSQLVRK